MVLRVFVATYTSVCGLCDEAIEPGDAACYVDDEPVHAQCATDEGYDIDAED